MRAINERVAAAVTRVTGSMWLLYVLVMLIAAWMRFAPGFGWDHAPSYPVMLYWVNLLQLLLLPVLAVGQAVLARSGEARAAHEARVVDRLEEMERHMLALQEDARAQRGRIEELLRGGGRGG